MFKCQTETWGQFVRLAWLTTKPINSSKFSFYMITKTKSFRENIFSVANKNVSRTSNSDIKFLTFCWLWPSLYIQGTTIWPTTWQRRFAQSIRPLILKNIFVAPFHVWFKFCLNYFNVPKILLPPPAVYPGGFHDIFLQHYKWLSHYFLKYNFPTGICLLKLNNGNTRTIYKIRFKLKLKMKTLTSFWRLYC